MEHTEDYKQGVLSGIGLGVLLATSITYQFVTGDADTGDAPRELVAEIVAEAMGLEAGDIAAVALEARSALADTGFDAEGAMQRVEEARLEKMRQDNVYEGTDFSEVDNG